MPEWVLLVDISENEREYQSRAELSGVRREDGTLTIAVERKSKMTRSSTALNGCTALLCTPSLSRTMPAPRTLWLGSKTAFLRYILPRPSGPGRSQSRRLRSPERRRTEVRTAWNEVTL